MANWFFCDDSTGEIITGGISSDEMAKLQIPPSGQTLYIVPDGMVNSPFSATPDFSVLNSYLRNKIDVEAGSFRSRFITDVPGQAQTYEKKETEARLWTAGDEISNPNRYPFMIAESTVRGLDISVVRGEIMAQVDALTPLAAVIEAHRIKAKQGVLSSTTLPDKFAAAVVDWEGLLP